MPASEAHQDTGVLVLVVGPSGVGKDTLIAYCRSRLLGRADVVFVRRVITRPAGDDIETHESVSTAEFKRRAAAGEFAIHWDAHGLRYGIPVSIGADLAAGRKVVLNGSRTIVDDARRRYGRVLVISVEADREIVGERLRRRGREPGADIDRRLLRGTVAELGDVLRIDNSGPVDKAGDALLRILSD